MDITGTSKDAIYQVGRVPAWQCGPGAKLIGESPAFQMYTSNSDGAFVVGHQASSSAVNVPNSLTLGSGSSGGYTALSPIPGWAAGLGLTTPENGFSDWSLFSLSAKPEPIFLDKIVAMVKRNPLVSGDARVCNGRITVYAYSTLSPVINEANKVASDPRIWKATTRFTQKVDEESYFCRFTGKYTLDNSSGTVEPHLINTNELFILDPSFTAQMMGLYGTPFAQYHLNRDRLTNPEFRRIDGLIVRVSVDTQNFRNGEIFPSCPGTSYWDDDFSSALELHDETLKSKSDDNRSIFSTILGR